MSLIPSNIGMPSGRAMVSPPVKKTTSWRWQ